MRGALNLDGDPSTQLVAKLPALVLCRCPVGWGLPNALVVVPAGGSRGLHSSLTDGFRNKESLEGVPEELGQLHRLVRSGRGRAAHDSHHEDRHQRLDAPLARAR